MVVFHETSLCLNTCSPVLSCFFVYHVSFSSCDFGHVSPVMEILISIGLCDKLKVK